MLAALVVAPGEMTAYDLVGNRQEPPVLAIRTLDPRLLANPSHPLVGGSLTARSFGFQTGTDRGHPDRETAT